MVKQAWGFLAVAAFAVSPVTEAAAQNARLLGQRARQLDLSPPTVQIWLQNEDYIPLGSPVRVAFSVDDDAYVVVARVDVQGRLTVLFPSTAVGRQDVAGNTTVQVRTIPDGDGTSFYANDRGVGLAFVFALASSAPFDLSRLERNEFERTAGNRNVSFTRASRRLSDPSQVVEEFSQRIQFNSAVPVGAAAAFYSVEQSERYYSTADRYASCDQYSNRYRRQYGLGDYRYSAIDGCSNPYAFSDQCFYAGYGAYGYYVPYGSQCFYGRGSGVASGPVVPTPTGPGTGPLNPWVTDSVRPPNPPVVDSGLVNGPHIMTSVDETAGGLEGRNLRGTLPWRGRGERPIADPFVIPPDVRVGPAPLPAPRGGIENRRGPDVIERPSRANPRADQSERLPQRGRQSNAGARNDVPRPQPQAQPQSERLPQRSSSPSRQRAEPLPGTPSGRRGSGSPSGNGSTGSQTRNDPPSRAQPSRSEPRTSSPPPRNDPPPRPATVRTEPSPRPSPPPEKKPGGGGSSQS